MKSQIQLKRLTTLINRGASPTYSDEGQAKFINQASIYWSGIKYSSIKLADEKKHTNNSRGYLNKGDILINSTGTGTLGRAVVFDRDNDGSYFADSHVTIMRPDKKRLDPTYASYALRSDRLQDEIYTTCVSGSTNQIELSREKFRDISLMNIDILQQQKIASYLDKKTATIDKMIIAKSSVQAYLLELRTAIITELVFGPQNNLTDGSTDQLYRHLTSQESGTWGEDPNGSNEVKCLRVADFDYGHLSHVRPSTIRSITHAHLRTKLLRKGDILLEKSGGGEKTPVGRAVIVNESQENTTYANFIDRLRFRDTVLPEYALYVLYALYAGGVNTKYIKQNTGIQNLDIKHYLMEPVPIPLLDEQHRIVKHAKARLSKLDTVNSLLNQSAAQLEEYRTSLISSVITGRVEI